MVNLYPKTWLSKKSSLFFALCAMLGLIVFLALVGLWGIRSVQERPETTVSELMAKTQLVVQMRAAARERTLILHRMILMSDPFERDEEYVRFNRESTKFAQARLQFMASRLSEQEKLILEQQRRLTNNVEPLQNKVVDLITNRKIDAARQVLIKEALPLQDRVLEQLSALLNYQEQETSKVVAEAEYANNDARLWMLVLSGIAGIIGIIVSVIVIRRVNQVSRDNDQHINQISKSNEAKSAFLANMSHEIRTPLTAILGFAELSLDSCQSMSEQQEVLKIIVRNSKHLLHIVNDILDLSKVEAEMLEIERTLFSPFQLLTEIDSLVRMQARNKGLEFSIDCQFPLPAQICSDPIRLKRILLNLTSNAIRFTQTGSVHIKVSCNPDIRQMSFSVADTGIGLTDEQMKRIFNPFVQADIATSRKFGGTGLGLSLSKKLSEMLGGSLIVQSQLGAGSSFIVSVDTGCLQQIKLTNEVDSAITGAKTEVLVEWANSLSGEILLVGDTPDNRQLLSMFLRNMGATVTVAENGKSAVDKTRAKTFDLILMDMQMPVMDGMETVSLLRKERYTGPIVALTANTMKEDRDRCLSVGFNNFIIKPVQRKHLYAVAAKYLRAAEVEDINTKPILSTLMEKEPEYADLVKQFISRLPGIINEFVTAFNKKDWIELKSVAHQLKGVGGGYGFPMLTEVAADIGVQLNKENYREIDVLIKKLQGFGIRICAVAEKERYSTVHAS